MLEVILTATLVLALLGVLLRWAHNREWGYAPTGGVRLLLLVVVLLLLRRV
jgi:Protein of unknown function (DUF3309)